MKNPYHANLRKAVVQLDLDGNEIKTFVSALVAAKSLGVSRAMICNACNGTRSPIIKKVNSMFKYSEDHKEVD